MYSRPQLFIDADDVKCSHGSTTGDVDKEALFYLMSRGVDQKQSRQMVLKAFVSEILELDAFKNNQLDVTNFFQSL